MIPNVRAAILILLLILAPIHAGAKAGEISERTASLTGISALCI
jgi:hypothetical protein